ncbi:T9SS type A sorting domain-containing protein [Flavobacterium sp.]
MFNTLGQLVISVVQPSNEEVVDVSRLAAGNYFVKMYSEKGVGVAKVVKE